MTQETKNTSGEKKKILVIEDDEYIRDLYVLILKNEGYHAIGCPDGAIGLTEARKGGAALIFLDLMMPNVSGLEFLKELKKKPSRKLNGPIIVMSNLAYGDAKDEALELGAIDFLVKADMEPKQIVEKVKEILARESSKF